MSCRSLLYAVQGHRGPAEASCGLAAACPGTLPAISFGPLRDSAGRLIGVNTAIYSLSGSSAGIGFAVPVDMVNRVVPQLIATGRYAPPVLGVIHDSRGDALLAHMGLTDRPVLDVEPGSPAEAAGLRPARITADGRLILGDVIVSLGGTPIETSEDLHAQLEALQAGDRVELGILRDGLRSEDTVTLAKGR